MKLLLVACLILTLTGCQPTMPATIVPQPPLVDCTLPMDAQIADLPTIDSITEWKILGVKLLGVIADDRIVHSKETSCLDKLRKAGLIR